jgi:hypothetical protein
LDPWKDELQNSPSLAKVLTSKVDSLMGKDLAQEKRYFDEQKEVPSSIPFSLSNCSDLFLRGCSTIRDQLTPRIKVGT